MRKPLRVTRPLTDGFFNFENLTKRLTVRWLGLGTSKVDDVSSHVRVIT